MTTSFSEKDLIPKFTESVLHQRKQSNFKFSEDDELLEMIDNPTVRSNTQNQSQSKANYKKNLTILKNITVSTPELVDEDENSQIVHSIKPDEILSKEPTIRSEFTLSMRK